ncbi:unnamed protein product [Echinostoma caproni]|uniref:Uncharacterized protein n=1 Tax=Echinostoma caproni TaxID=27848 RepID=A0A183AE98_9TREM|nr:unnamed protein product [Echinostoma caproni]
MPLTPIDLPERHPWSLEPIVRATCPVGNPSDPMGGMPAGWCDSGTVSSQYTCNLGVPRASYNPMAGMDDGHSGDIDALAVSGRPPIYQSALNLHSNQAGYDESTTGSSGKRSLAQKLKH